jgi:hypothetical protein
MFLYLNLFSGNKLQMQDWPSQVMKWQDMTRPLTDNSVQGLFLETSLPVVNPGLEVS